MPTSVPDLAVAEWLSAFRLRASSAETCDSGSARFCERMAPWGVVQTREQAGDSIFEDIPERACWCTGVLFRGFAPPEKLLCLGLDLGLGKRALVPSAALVDRASPKWEIQMLRILVLTARRRPVVPASPAREFPGDVADSALTQDEIGRA